MALLNLLYVSDNPWNTVMSKNITHNVACSPSGFYFCSLLYRGTPSSPWFISSLEHCHTIYAGLQGQSGWSDLVENRVLTTNLVYWIGFLHGEYFYIINFTNHVLRGYAPTTWKKHLLTHLGIPYLQGSEVANFVSYQNGIPFTTHFSWHLK